MENVDGKKLFPIVSIKALTENYINGNACGEKLHDDPAIKNILLKLTDAFTEWGFVYMVDHGIESAEAFNVSRQFFEKEKSFKEQYVRGSNKVNWGYIPFKFETFDKNLPFDLKECFNFNTEPDLPEEKMSKISDFFKVATKFSHDCHVLTNMLLSLLSPAVLQGSKDFLLTKHREIDNHILNPTILRMLYYPSIDSEQGIMEHQLRCGEHSDYGTITLLFQDDVGGLQVLSPNGEYIDATPVPGSVIVNIADMMERWTSGRFKSQRHRVLIPNNHNIARQSLAYFVHPDNDVEVYSPDDSDKRESVNAYKYLLNKLSSTYD